MADESVLTGMLNALIDNAVTFTQKGGRVELSAHAEGRQVRLAISDNGPGVAAADLSRILQPFEHAGKVADHAKGAGPGPDPGQGLRGTAWRPFDGRKHVGRRLQGRSHCRLPDRSRRLGHSVNFHLHQRPLVRRERGGAP